MKKTYIEPSVEVDGMEAETIICATQGVTSSDKGIGYGGADEDGDLDPAARRYDVWEGEEGFE